MKIFPAESDSSKKPSDLRKKIIAASNAQVVDDVAYLIRSCIKGSGYEEHRSPEVRLGISRDQKISKKSKAENLTNPPVVQSKKATTW